MAIEWTGWVRVPKAPNRLAAAVIVGLEEACAALGHPGACGLLNRALIWERLSFRNPLYPALWRLYEASSDHRFEELQITPETSTNG